MSAWMKSAWARYRRAAIIAILVITLSGQLMAASSQGPLINFNFTNTDIAMVMKSLAEAGHVNIVVAPDIKGQISLKLNDVTLEQAIEIITQMSGCSYTLSNGAYLISKANGAGKPEKVLPKEYAVQKLKVLTPEDVISALSVAYADVQVKAMADSRLVLAGETERLKAARAFIDEIDVMPAAVTADKVEETYQIKAVIPRQAKQYIEDLYRGQGLTVSYAPNHRWQDDAVPATGEANALIKGINPQPAAVQSWESDTLILRGPATVVNLAKANLQKIDVNVVQAEKRVSVKRIYATQAIAYLLDQYEDHGLVIVTAPMTFTASVDKGAAKEAASGAIGTRVTRDKNLKLNIAEPVGDFILLGGEDVVRQAEAELAKIDVGPARVERIHTLRFLHVGETQTKLTELYGPEGLQVTVAPSQRGDTPTMATSTGDSTGSKTVTDEQKLQKVNDLVLSGPEDVVARAEALLETLDTQSAQIAIQVEIVSIDSGEMKQLGVEWPSSIGVNLSEVQSGDPLQLGRIVRDPIKLAATINLLETRNKAKVISKPSTVVQNGRDATIHVGDKLLVETVSSLTESGPAYTTTTIDAGVTLQVLPQMSRDGVITLGITTVVSTVTGFNKGPSGAELPQFTETKSATTVQVKDGDMLVIGGLKQNSTSVTRKSVPILGQLPIVGALFSSKLTQPSDRELLIIVRPRVVKPQAATDATPGDATPAK